jgi:phosphopantetheinyl transferase (holo-ACP synthase)
MSGSLSLGVDLMEFKRAREFYDNCRHGLDGFLGPGEIRFVRGSRKPWEALAVLLAAKEAVFKALDLSWMGLSGFKAIRILPACGNKTMSFALSGHLRAQLSKNIPRRLFLKKHKTYVVVGFAAKL